MAVITVEDVLRTAEDFESALVDYYADLSERTTKQGVKLLVDYIGRHRRRLSEALDRLPEGASERIRSRPIRYEPVPPDRSCFEDNVLPPDASASEVLDIAVEVDECLMALYRQVLRQDLDPEVRELFEGLVKCEERDTIDLKKIKAMDYF
jgi:rubrerythrin